MAGRVGAAGLARPRLEEGRPHSLSAARQVVWGAVKNEDADRDVTSRECFVAWKG